MAASGGIPIVNLPNLYMNGLKISNNATTPNTLLDVAVGQCRDSSNTVDMVLSTAVTINAAANGINGLDTGTFAASKVYNVFLVSDPVDGNTTGAMISLSSTPLLPFGYSAYRLIGFAVTDASTHFLKAYWTAGNTGLRTMNYDAPQATAVTAGNATSFTAVALTTLVPAIEDLQVSLAYAFTPGAASRTFAVTPGNGTGNAVTITGQVTSVVVSGNLSVGSKVTSAVPEVDYKVANSGDAVAINVAGFTASL